MSEHTDSVKEAMRLIRKSADALKERQPEVATERSFLVGRLENVIEYIGGLEVLTSALPPELGNINDLPQELRDELLVGKTDEIEDQIVTVINAYGGEASLDQILVGLFRKFQVVQKRKFLMNKLYRMPMIWSVEGRKGIYTTQEAMAVRIEENESDAGRSKPIFEKDLSDDEMDSDFPF